MAAEESFSDRRLRSERGQSVLEFLFALPVMFIFTAMLIKINTVIQVSLVNQKYARAQAHYLTYNSPYFPTIGLREANMVSQGANQMIIGVSATPMEVGRDGSPDPTIVAITRRGVTGSDERETPRERSKVRVRTTVAMCSQQSVLADGTPALPLVNAGEKTWLAAGPSRLSDGVKFEPCRSDLK